MHRHLCQWPIFAENRWPHDGRKLTSYSASALDLPRLGVAHAEGGLGAIARTLAEAVRRNGGQVHFRQEATRIVVKRGRPVAVETGKGAVFPADVVIANLPPWNVTRLLGEYAPRRLRALPLRPKHLWGAFMVYVGLDGAAVPAGSPLHHQVVLREPMGNGNTVFLSLSPDWDEGRAPQGRRTLTLSTHTELDPWRDLYEHDREAYEARRKEFTGRVLTAAEVALPGLWLVGDSVFPGQSVPAVASGGLRVARSLLAELGLREVPLKAPGEPQFAFSSIWR